MTAIQAEQEDATRPSPKPRPGEESDRPAEDEVVDTSEANRNDPPEADSAGDEPPGADSDGAVAGGFRLPKPQVAVLIGVLVCLLAAAVTFGTLWLVERASESARGEAQSVAKEFALDLTTYDYRELDENFEEVRAFSTDNFAEKYQGASGKLSTLLTENKAISKGRVLHAGVEEFDGDRAVVLVFVDMTVNNVNAKDRIDRNRMVLTLIDVDGDWKLDDVKLT